MAARVGIIRRMGTRQVRLETYCEDFGQTSGVTTEGSREIPLLLELTADSPVLEVRAARVSTRGRLRRRVGWRIWGWT